MAVRSPRRLHSPQNRILGPVVLHWRFWYAEQKKTALFDAEKSRRDAEQLVCHARSDSVDAFFCPFPFGAVLFLTTFLAYAVFSDTTPLDKKMSFLICVVFAQ
jgi:hypothetical protein